MNHKFVGQLITIVEVNSELGAGTRGASLGIPSLQTASLSSDNSIFSHPNKRRIDTENDLLLQPSTTPGAHYVDAIARTYDRLCNELKALYSNNQYPFIVAGDHSMAGGTIAGIKAAHPDKRLGVVWIDAHADLHSPYTSPSGNVHGMPLATAIAYDNREHERPDHGATEATVKGWEQLKNTGGISPKVAPEDIVFIAVRDTEEQEDAICEKFGITNHTVDQLRDSGAASIAQQTLDALSDCDLIYISFDVDSLDTSISVGTGTPVPHGLTVAEVNELLDVFLAHEKTTCFEVVEVNPLLDTENKMAKAVYPIIERAFQTISARK